MGILRDRMIEEMKLRNFSPATQESYVYAVSRLARYHNKSPDQLSKEDIRAFLELRASGAVGLRWQAVFGSQIVWNKSTRCAGARVGRPR
jgi:integrase/recombinase XerD